MFLQHRVVEMGKIVTGAAKEFGDVSDWVYWPLAIKIQGHIKVALLTQGIVKLRAWLYTLGHLKTNLTPLVDHPGADHFVGLVNTAVMQYEGHACLARFFQ